MNGMAQETRPSLWRQTRRLTFGLLGVWLVVSLAVPWFARDLAGWRGLGFPLGYWLAAEGALAAFLIVIVIYVVAMDRLEDSHRQTACMPAQPAPTSSSGKPAERG